jgi:carbon-monoxide dehydrogenase large subunit
MRKINSLIGSPAKRVEDPRFLRGRGEFVDDLSRDGMLHAAILRSPIAHGRVRVVDGERARAIAGVHTVVTATDVIKEMGFVPTIPIRLAPMPALQAYVQPVVAETKVRFVGEPLALVVADTAALAEDALATIEFDIEKLPAVTNRTTAGSAEVALFEDVGREAAVTYVARRGDAVEAFRTADYTRRERFAIHRHSGVPLEPRGIIAEWNDAGDRLTVWGAAKVPFAVRAGIAGLFEIDEHAIEMIENDVGGGFGIRGEFAPEDFLVPFAARRLARPVKWVEDRREHLLSGTHARESECEIEIACRKDGTIVGLRGRSHTDMGAYVRGNGVIGPRNVAQFLSGPYRIENIESDVTLLMTNKSPIGTYRGPGRFEADFFRERLMDMAAGDLGIDRIELRRRNLVPKDEMPYRLASITPCDADDELDSGDHSETLDRCLAEFGWDEKSDLQGRLIDGRRHGIALSCFVEGGAAGPSEVARLVLGGDGKVSVLVGSSAIGQGLETVFTQIAADALEWPMDTIRGVFHGSTAHVSQGFGSFHSRSVVMGGSAILKAAESLKTAIRQAAADRWSCAADAVEIIDGERVAAAGRETMTLAELAGDGIDVEERFDNHKHTWAYGAHAAHVAVDAETGHVEVIDYVAVEDVGRIINPVTLAGQSIGAVVQGLGGVFLENMVYDNEGQPQATTLADYLMPTAGDVPRIHAFLLENHPSPINPLGAKGAGEGGVVPVGGVISNAVANALSSLGVEPMELPLSPPNIWRMIKAAGAKMN